MTTTKNPEALGWKHGYPQGIRTSDGVITAWPLGPVPSQAQVDQWEVEYDAAKLDLSPLTIDDLIRALKAKGVNLTATDLSDAKRNR